MKAAVLRQFGRFEIEDVTLDAPREDEVRIRVLASGLCHSDYHVMTGAVPVPLPLVAGHEAAGVVEAVGADVHEFAPGDLVVSCLSGFCGQCGQCQRGHNYRCDAPPGRAGWPADARLRGAGGEPVYQLGRLGAFAEEMLVHRRSLVKLSGDVPPAAAALLGCAVLTGVGAVLHAARVEAGASVAVIGCGGVGLNVIQGARLAGAGRIFAVDLHPDKLDAARRFGATDLVPGADAARQVIELTGGGVDYAFEVIGLPATMRYAVAMLRKGGTAVLVGMAPAGAELALPVAPFLLKEIRVIGTMMGSVPFQLMIPQLVRHYRQGALLLDELVSETVPLTGVNEAYGRVAGGHVARIVMDL